ncbi:hypothetical protein [Capnocytophaga canis]|uniref:hypothetical protein n=1 Tax=Capnocytophaga canis TaxID=1848903 RepID=UPI0015627896|nr:hypothetical protein [Capnocytophaga canis]
MNKILDDLIFKGKELLQKHKQKEWFEYIDIQQDLEYIKWVEDTGRLISVKYPKSKKGFLKHEKDVNIKGILSVLEAVKRIPESTEKNNKGNNIYITNNQTQNNSQEINLNIFNEAIKDEITGKQLKELKEILAGFKEDPEKTKSTLLEKIKGFGSDVLSNIVANILTNPAIYNSL